MSTKKSQSRSESGAATPSFASADWPRQQLALGTAGSCALLRGFEALRKIQMDAAHESLAQHESAAQKLRGPCSLADAMGVQADLVRHDTQGAALYWQRLGAAMLEMQRQLLASITHAAQADTEDAATALQPNQWVLPGLAELLQANGAQRAHH